MNGTDDSFTPATFEFNSYINAFTSVPRFGHSTDFAKLFSNSTSDQVDYSLGTIFVSGILFAFFLLWILLLVIFMCCGPRRVGFLAGFRMKEPLQKGVSVSTRDKKKPFRLPILVRMVMILSCLIVIAAAVVPVFVFGFNNLKEVSDSTSQVGKDLAKIGFDGRNLTNVLTAEDGLNEVSKIRRDLMVNELRPDNFCTFAGLPASLTDSMNDAQQALYDLENFYQTEFVDLKNDLFLNVEVRGLQIESNVDRFGVRQWYLWFYLAAFALIAFLALMGTIFTWAGKPLHSLNCMLTWVLVPVLVILITIAWIVLGFVSMGAVMVGDYCRGDDQNSGPDATSLRIIQLLGNQEKNPIIYYVDNYIFSGCQSYNETESPLLFLSDEVDRLDIAIEKITDFSAEMDNYTLSALSQDCGGKDFTGLRIYLDEFVVDYNTMKSITMNVENLVTCERLNPIYTNYVYDDACTEAPEGMIWGWVFLFCLSFFGMMLVTFRSAWLEIVSSTSSSSSPINEFEYDVVDSPVSRGSSEYKSPRSALSSNGSDTPRQLRSSSHVEEENDDDDKMAFEEDEENEMEKIKSEQEAMSSVEDFLDELDNDDYDSSDPSSGK